MKKPPKGSFYLILFFFPFRKKERKLDAVISHYQHYSLCPVTPFGKCSPTPAQKTQNGNGTNKHSMQRSVCACR